MWPFKAHLNCWIKIVIRQIGANISPSMIQWTGKTIEKYNMFSWLFENLTSSEIRSDSHPPPRLGKDYDTFLIPLDSEYVFTPLLDWHNQSIKFRCGLIQSLSRKEQLRKRLSISMYELFCLYLFFFNFGYIYFLSYFTLALEHSSCCIMKNNIH